MLKQKPAKNKGNDGVDFDKTRDEVKVAGERYSKLQTQTKDLLNKLQNIKEQEKVFTQDMDKLLNWISDTKDKVQDMKDLPPATEPVELQKQLDSLKEKKIDLMNKAKDIEDIKKSQAALVDNLKELHADTNYVNSLEEQVEQLEEEHNKVTADLTEKDNQLHTALVQSQGVQEGIDGLLNWIEGAEKDMQRAQPISLVESTLNDQLQESNMLKTDIDIHKASVDSVNDSGKDVVDSAMADSIRHKLDNLNDRYGNVAEKCDLRKDNLDEVKGKMDELKSDLQELTDWMTPNLESLDDPETTELDNEEFQKKIKNLEDESVPKRDLLDKIKVNGQALIDDSRTGETWAVREQLKDCERTWLDLQDVLGEKHQEAEFRSEQSDKYNALKEEVDRWINNNEEKLDSLKPIEVEMEDIEKQIEEIQPLVKDFDEFSPKIDDLNDARSMCDALMRGDAMASPVRKSKLEIVGLCFSWFVTFHTNVLYHKKALKLK